MKTLKFLALFTAVLLVGFSACKKDDDDDDDNNPPPPPEENIVDGNISENTTWAIGETYELAASVSVLDGTTLTIEPGLIIKG
jgi:hypothetical protein